MFEKITIKDVYLLVADQIRYAILSGKIKPGERLPPERELAKMFGVSRVAVREALRSLETLQFIERRLGPRGGAYVRLPGTDHIKTSIASMFILRQISFDELVQTWQIIEPPLAELAARYATEEEIAEMEQSLLQAEAATESALTVVESSKFHDLVARASKNRVLALISESTRVLLTEQIVKILPPREHNERVLRHHREIFEAIRRRDPERAYQKMLEDALEAANLKEIVEANLRETFGAASVSDRP